MPRQYPKRKYKDIWDKIKNKEECKIKCSPKSMKTIKTGVIKEKYHDTAFSLSHSIENLFLKIEWQYSPGAPEGVLIFTLKSRFGLTGVKDESFD